MTAHDSTVASGNAHMGNAPGQERSLPRRATAEPASLQAATDELLLVKAEIIDIQAQIVGRKASAEADLDAPGQEPAPDYLYWRSRAITALKAKEARLSFLKRWITINNRRTETQSGTSGKSGKSAIADTLADIIDVLDHDDEAALERLIAWRDAHRARQQPTEQDQS